MGPAGTPRFSLSLGARQHRVASLSPQYALLTNRHGPSTSKVVPGLLPISPTSPRPAGNMIRGQGRHTSLDRPEPGRLGSRHHGSQPSEDQVVFITELGKVYGGANNESLFCC